MTNPPNPDWLRYVPLLQVILTAAVGAATAFVGTVALQIQRQQATTNRLQYRLALFEKRMKVFDCTMELITTVLRKNAVELPELFKLLHETREHELLFGSEVGDYINKIYHNGVDLEAIEAARSGKPTDSDQRAYLLNWFSEQSKETPSVFLKYLDFRQP